MLYMAFANKDIVTIHLTYSDGTNRKEIFFSSPILKMAFQQLFIILSHSWGIHLPFISFRPTEFGEKRLGKWHMRRENGQEMIFLKGEIKQQRF